MVERAPPGGGGHGADHGWGRRAAGRDLARAEATSLHAVSALVVASALARAESRGCHRWRDVPATSGEPARHTVLRVDDGQLRLAGPVLASPVGAGPVVASPAVASTAGAGVGARAGGGQRGGGRPGLRAGATA